MANIKISDLTGASAAADANELEINEAGTSKKLTVAQVSTKVISDIVTADITALGALMDSELTSLADVKAIDQGLATTDTVQHANINLGAATDTTISRTSAGIIAVEGSDVLMRSDEATLSEWRANTTDKVLTTDRIWAAMAEVTLTDGANISWDMDAGFDFVVTLAGNRTLDNPTNTKVGQRGEIRVVQDGTGSRTLSFGTSYEFAGGSAPTLTTTASADDILYYRVLSSTRILVSSALDWS
jgi:hypothetical protein